ncbi:MAG: hypothetical protein AAAFM81_05905 [Pseudomonadota bacterium]
MFRQSSLSTRLFEQISALNQSFIDVMDVAARSGAVDVSHDILHGLTHAHADQQSHFDRLPFLLYRLYDAASTHPGPSGIPDDIAGASDLVTLTASFIWQLAQEDVALATLVTGFDQVWCQNFGQNSIADLAGFATRARLRIRLVDAPGYWQDLVRQRGISSLQRASLGATGLQLILSRARRHRARRSLPKITTSEPGIRQR